MSARRLKPNGAIAIMASRHEPPDSLDFFPTPPWATRALTQLVIHRDINRRDIVWDPCCGEGHMVEPLQESFVTKVIATDIWPYGYGAVMDFLDPAVGKPQSVDWIVMNPPFNAALAFTLKALEIARCGVAVFARSQWAEGEERYRRLWRPIPPSLEACFAERVGLVKGRYDPRADTATAFSWWLWITGRTGADCRKVWIPPGTKRRFEMPEDVRRWAPADAPLFDGEWAQ